MGLKSKVALGVVGLVVVATGVAGAVFKKRSEKALDTTNDVNAEVVEDTGSPWGSGGVFGEFDHEVEGKVAFGNTEEVGWERGDSQCFTQTKEIKKDEDEKAIDVSIEEAIGNGSGKVVEEESGKDKEVAVVGKTMDLKNIASGSKVVNEHEVQKIE